MEMDKKQWVIKFWQDIADQHAENLRVYFAPDAIVNWHNTNEQFSAEEFIRANCDYPGNWRGQVERIEVVSENLLVTVTRVWPADGGSSFHAVSFLQTQEQKIAKLDEYWGDDGTAPQWRLDQNIGNPIV
jgi:hypothetical protein